MEIKEYQYEEDYFKDYFPKELNKFTPKDIKKVRNWFWGWFRYLNKFVNLRDGNNRKVLEIGCAIGGFSSLLKERNFDVYTSDISSYVINYARKFWPEIKFYEFDIQEGIPINEQFEIIFAFEVLEHLGNPLEALKNMYKKLFLNGTLICSTPPPYKKYFKIKGHVNIKSKEEWFNLFQQAGFLKQNIFIKQVNFMPYFYRFSKFFSFTIPLKFNLPYFNSTYFIIAKK